MRLSLWLLALTALSTGGCVFPCSNGACSSTGEPRYVTPASRFFGTEKLLPQTLSSSQCDLGQCQPSPYLTCSKYLPFMDRWTSSAMAKRCANRYLLRQQIQTRTWISKHYKAGFHDAFQDVANGESGEVPAVPPPKYWNTHYRTEKGKQCVELYFDGYRSGSALAASELTTMKTIGASYDWSIQKPKGPCAPSAAYAGGGSNCGHGGACSTGQGCALNSGGSPGGPGQSMPYSPGMPSQFGPPSAGCQTGGMPPEQPTVFSVGPQTNGQPPSSGIGPANSYPPPGNYGPVPDPGFGQQQRPYQSPPSQFGVAPGASPQQSRQVSPQTLGLPSPSGNGLNSRQFNSGRGPNLPSPALPTPGYASPGGTFGGQSSPQNQPSFNNQPGAGSQQGGSLTPGYSRSPGGQVTPGKLGPPDQFKSEPPAWRYPAPQR
ncbi:MAG: hypothetical protein ACKVII_00390 [Planctomycetales bacterium]|jgi:hypothetical protein